MVHLIKCQSKIHYATNVQNEKKKLSKLLFLHLNNGQHLHPSRHLVETSCEEMSAAASANNFPPV